uniref:Divergent protein kinase domain 2Ab n=1 Tax=Hucho hucho TaxID=62062 RepID=A0A4W5L237_9TELE
MLCFLPLKLGRLYRCLKLLLVVGLFVILLMNTHNLFASFQKNELTDRRFINLNKCPACFGTSWCRKFMNGQVSFETWGRLRFLDVFNVKNVYFAQYGEPREGTRRVVLKRLGSNQELADIDQKICKRATGRPRCDLIQAIYKTEFARLNGDVRLLTPEVVEGWSDLVHCPSQRLLDRVVRRYAETKDSGSFLLKNLKDTERMQLLMTLAFNPEPLVLQVGTTLSLFALWQGAPSCRKRHCSSPNCSWMVGRSCSRRMGWYHSLFMAVFLGKIVSEPTPLAEKQPHTRMVSGCFTVGMTQD